MKPVRPQPAGAEASAARLDKALDEALEETFPASDPIAIEVDDIGDRRPAARTAREEAASAKR